jgi:predicted cupin superfamily sugar epimerase
LKNRANYYISKLNLSPHPEGGYFKEIYRSDENINAKHLPKRYKADRVFSTSIYFLLEKNQVSSLHKIKSDEIWHFYIGSGVKIYVIEKNGKIKEILLGNKLENGELPLVVINKNSWFGAELLDKSSFCLVGCTVSPGFEYNDFELGDREKLLNLFPQHEKIIKKLTKFNL